LVPYAINFPESNPALFEYGGLVRYVNHELCVARRIGGRIKKNLISDLFEIKNNASQVDNNYNMTERLATDYTIKEMTKVTLR